MTPMDVHGNVYNINAKKPYYGNSVSADDFSRAFEFAYEMAFGSGHHKCYRAGGNLHRRAGEIFCNTFQGKLAELGLYESLLYQGIICDEPDFGVYGFGEWDSFDLKANGRTISVKSAAFFSNLLLNEASVYDRDGNYTPNLKSGKPGSYDYYALVRVSPDVKSLFRRERLLYEDRIEKDRILELLNREPAWTYDVTGWIEHREFVEAIREMRIIPKGSLLNGRIQMDADNYYVQSGDMHPLPELTERLKACR